MIETNDSVVIARPLDEVYEFVADVRNDPSWNPDMIEAQLAPGSGPEIGPGTEFNVRFKPFMGASTCTMRVTDAAKDAKLVLEGAPGRLKARAEFRFDAMADGTKVTRSTRVEMPGPMRLLEPLGRRRLQQQSHAMLQALKAALESPPTTG